MCLQTQAVSFTSGKIPLSLRCKYMHTHHFLKLLFALSNPHAKHKHRSLSNYPCPLLFLSPELSVVVYLLLPYNFAYKTLAYTLNTGFVLNTCLTVNTCITLFSKRIWLLKPCKNVCSCQKGHVNTSLILEHRKDHRKQQPRQTKLLVRFSHASCWYPQ